MQATKRSHRGALAQPASNRGNGTEGRSAINKGEATPSSVPDDRPSGPDSDSGAESDDSGGEREGEDDEELPKDVQFDILKNRRRRLVLRYLSEHENPVSLGTLSEHVASVENDKEVRLLDFQERKRAYVGLYQCHLPRMDDADVIAYNKNRGQVSLGPNAEALEQHLDHETPTQVGGEYTELYLASALVGIGGLLVAESGVAGDGWLAPAVVVLACLSIVALAADQLRSRSET